VARPPGQRRVSCQAVAAERPPRCLGWSGLLRRLSRNADGSGELGELDRAVGVQGHIEVAAEPAGAGLSQAQTADEGVGIPDRLATEIADVLLPHDDTHRFPQSLPAANERLTVLCEQSVCQTVG